MPRSLRANWWARACAAFVLCAATAITLPAQTFKTLHSFDSTDGSEPIAGLIQGTDGNLYGTTFGGGTNGGYGTVYRITTGGTLTSLQSFDTSDGSFPGAGVVQGRDGNFYGTTSLGGANTCLPEFATCGAVFRITPSGTLTVLHSFDGSDGAGPESTLVQGADESFYGTTQFDGAHGYGTVFKITPGGTLTTLYSFCSQNDCADGAEPQAGLLLATDGNLYGTTFGYPGILAQYGTVFKITPDGTLTTLHTFSGADGAEPFGTLIQSSGNLYGTTYIGGAVDFGTIFKISLTGAFTTLYSFCSQSGCADGTGPVAGLTEATDGNLYGTTYLGGAHGGGTAFQITPNGRLTVLHSFNFNGNPEGVLLQDTNGTLYGTTQTGGSNNDGTVFSLSIGLGPFVKTQPTSGKVGAAVKILGTYLADATSVTFNGTAATFSVVSPSLLTTTVPAGATTGEVKVIKTKGTVRSNVPFRVIP